MPWGVYSPRFHGQAMWRPTREWTPFAYSAAPKAISPEWKVVSSLCSFVSFVHWPAANRLKRGFRFKTAHVTKTAEPVTVHDSLEKLNRTGRNSQTFFPTCFCSGRQTSNSFFLGILTWTVWRNAIYNFISGDLLNWGEICWGFFCLIWYFSFGSDFGK